MMATFQHNRYPQIQLHDGDAVWAQFEGGRFRTEDDEVAERLRNATDPDLVEVEEEPADDPGAGQADPYPGVEATVDAILGWVGDDPEKARVALDAELGAERSRSTVLAKLEKLAG